MPTSQKPFRLGLPSVVAVSLLLFFLAQCLWFMARVPLSQAEGSYLEEGLLHISRLASASSEDRSPLIAILAGIPAKIAGGDHDFARLNDDRFLVRLPFLLTGLLLGVSLWYLARRLYGNVGGYVALGLYCFSPLVVVRACQVQPDIVAAWGAIGVVFTAIALAHTLYAPRPGIFWNWKRIVLLGIAIAICVGAQWTLWVVLLPALAFLLWVGHVRPGAALAIFAASCAAGLLFLWAIYSFRPHDFAQALLEANWLELSQSHLSARLALSLLSVFLLQNGLGSLILLSVTLGSFLFWKRTRFFGTAAPLITAAFLMAMGLIMQHFAGVAFLFIALPFLMLFMAGVSADLLETRYAVVANAIVVGVLIANAIFDVYGLMQLVPSSR